VIPPVHVNGLGLWAPGFRDAVAWAAGAPDQAVVEPPASLLAAALRRRATPLTRMAAEVAAQAAGQAGASIAASPLVFGSALGEVACAREIIASFREDGGLPSPTRFHNSVHNTAVGYLSIATGNRHGASAVAAGPATTAAALIEAAMLLAERGGSVLLLLADEAIPAPLDPWGGYRSAAAALHLTAAPVAGTLAAITNLRRGPASLPAVPEAWRGHPCAGGLALVAAIVRGSSGPQGLGPWTEDGWSADLEAVPP
jgi:hypothetical protein